MKAMSEAKHSRACCLRMAAIGFVPHKRRCVELVNVPFIASRKL